MEKIELSMPEDLKECISFHGHLCPGLLYGYLVANKAINLLELKRSRDEEVVAICENDSCAVDALQVLLGTTIGKGNLIIKDYGKNAYTILNRSTKRSYRFSRKNFFSYKGKYKDEFDQLDKAISLGSATEQEKWRQKLLKAEDLLSRSFDEIFSTNEEKFIMPPYAPLAPSKPCAKCGEMTMSTKMITGKNDKLLCISCEK